jgi:hypothetical protein
MPEIEHRPYKGLSNMVSQPKLDRLPADPMKGVVDLLNMPSKIQRVKSPRRVLRGDRSSLDPRQ